MTTAGASKARPMSDIVAEGFSPGVLNNWGLGYDVLKSIRSDQALSSLPVVVLTAKGQANDRRTAEALGASAFITKPFANADVVERVTRLAGGAERL